MSRIHTNPTFQTIRLAIYSETDEGRGSVTEVTLTSREFVAADIGGAIDERMECV